MFCKTRSAVQLIFSCIPLISLIFIASCSSTFLDFSQPGIISIDPADKASFTDTNQVRSVTIKFTKTMNQASVEKAFQLKQTVLAGFNDAPIAGLFTWKDPNELKEVVFTPVSNFIFGKYTLSFSSSAEDSAGNNLIYGTNITFEIAYDAVLPEIQTTIPVNNTTNLSGSNFSYTIFFTEPMDPAGISSYINLSPAFPFQAVMLSNNTVLSIQALNLVNNGRYTLTLNQMSDSHGNKMHSLGTFYFTIGSEFDPPLFLGIFTNTNIIYPPLLLTNGLNSIDKLAPLYFIFNEAVNIDVKSPPVTITPALTGTWQCNSNILSFIPGNPWDLYSVYQFAVNPGIEDFSGNMTAGTFRANTQILSAASHPVLLTGVRFMTNWSDGTNWQLKEMNVMDYTNALTLEFLFNSSIDPVTVLNNISITRVYGSTLDATAISMVQFMSNSLANDSIRVSIISNGANLYQLSLNGGINGVRDASGNWISNTIQFYYLTRP